MLPSSLVWGVSGPSSELETAGIPVALWGCPAPTTCLIGLTPADLCAGPPGAAAPGPPRLLVYRPPLHAQPCPHWTLTITPGAAMSSVPSDCRELDPALGIWLPTAAAWGHAQAETWCPLLCSWDLVTIMPLNEVECCRGSKLLGIRQASCMRSRGQLQLAPQMTNFQPARLSCSADGRLATRPEQ